MRKWIVPGLVTLVGVVLIVVAIARNLFAVGPAFESMIDDFRPWLTDDSIAALRADLDGLGGAADEFQNGLAAALIAQLQTTPEAFGILMETEFPAVATGMQVVPDAVVSFTGIVDLLDEQQGNFASADAIPTESLPATTVPWGMALAGALAIAVGLIMGLFRERLGAILAVVLGVLLVVAPLVLSLPGKAADADDLNAALEPVYTPEMVQDASGALDVVGAMGAEMAEKMLPGLGGMLGMTGPEVEGFLGTQFPTIAGAMAGLPDAMGRFTGMLTAFSDNLDEYDVLKPVAFVPIVWTIIAAGAALLVLGGIGLWKPATVAVPREREVKVPASV